MSDKPVIEIIIRSNLPNAGKTFIAARLTGVLKDEFGAATYIENAKDDVQEAIYVLNQDGTPRLDGLTVLIRDEDQPIDPDTLTKLAQETPIAPQLKRHPTDLAPGESVQPTETPNAETSV